MHLELSDIRQLAAGRELDGLIVEHIFGFRRSHYGEQLVFESPAYALNPLDMNNVVCLRGAPGGRESIIRGDVPKKGWPNTLVDFYSTEIAAAWKVVEQLNELGYLLDLTRRKDFARTTYPYECELWNIASSGPDVSAIADTAPLAICRAALMQLV